MELIRTNISKKTLRSLVIIFTGSLALILSAKLKIPFYPIPMTMQTFVVVFLGIAEFQLNWFVCLEVFSWNINVLEHSFASV